MENQQLSDEELVKKTLENVDFFGILMQRYESKLLFYIKRISNISKEEAEEVLQEVFLKTWRNLRDFSGEVKFSSWIFRIAHNETISNFRKIQSRGLDEKTDLEDEELQNLASKIDLENEISRDLDAKNIAKVLDLLPEKYREVLVLKFLEEKSTSEISDILQKPENTVSTLIHRAKQQFSEEAKRLGVFID